MTTWVQFDDTASTPKKIAVNIDAVLGVQEATPGGNVTTLYTAGQNVNVAGNYATVLAQVATTPAEWEEGTINNTSKLVSVRLSAIQQVLDAGLVGGNPQTYTNVRMPTPIGSLQFLGNYATICELLTGITQ